MDTSIIKDKALFLVDGSYLLYRSYYALQSLHTSSGKPTQAIYGFCRAIHIILQTFKPHSIAVIWDSKGGSFRNELYPAYKANRLAPPADLFEQKQEIIRFLNIIKMASIAHTGFEADDIIASLARTNDKTQTVLLCADKDLYQLLSPSIIVGDIFKNKLIDEALFTAERTFHPDKLPFLYALLGDASDNIPGVKGVGEKTALEIIQLFESLDDLYTNLDRVPRERIKKLLSDQRENAYLSLELFKLTCLDFKYNPHEVLYDAQQWHNAADFFAELEFKSLVKTTTKPTIITASSIPQQSSLFGDMAPQSQETAKPKHVTHLINTRSDLTRLVAQLNNQTLIALDTETSGLRPLQDSLLGISCAFNTDETFYINLQQSHNQSTIDGYTKTEALSLLKPVLENDAIKKVLHHAKFDALFLKNNGISLQGCIFDTLLAANILRQSWQKISLKDLSQFYLHEPMQTYQELVGKQYKTFADVPLQAAAAYAGHDALQTLKLYHLLHEKLAQTPSLQSFFDTVELPCMNVLLAMEAAGILLDIPVVQELDRTVGAELTIAENKLLAALPPTIGPATFNVQSPKQIEELLFDHLNLPVTKKSPKGARSTDHEVLEELSRIHPIPRLIVHCRELAKLKSTYLEPLPTYVNPATHRIHTSFSQTMAATGRLSSSDPNLQNIPASASHGLALRKAFIAAPGHVLLSADYSQIELRVLAELSGDINLTNAFLQGKDIHTETTAKLFGIMPEEVTPHQRQLGKRINFSVIYGLTPYGLSKDLNIKPSEAKEYIANYFAQYPTVRTWMDELVAAATESGYVTTWSGKRRYVPELREKIRCF